MNYWRILEIDKTTDIKAIKRAYAVKLKKNKPDENPEGFKDLHAAYKSATRYAKENTVPSTAETHESTPPATAEDQYQSPNSENRTKPEIQEQYTARQYYPEPQKTWQEDPGDSAFEPAEKHAGSQENADPYHSELEQVASAADDENFAWLQEQWNELRGNVDQVAESIHRINDLRSWRFFNDREALLDLQFKSEMSRYVFSKIVDALNNITNKQIISKSVLDYLDRIFHWSDRRDFLEDEYGLEVVDLILRNSAEDAEQAIKWTSPKFHKGDLIYAGYYTRIFSTLIDWMMFSFLATWIIKTSSSMFDISATKQGFDFYASVLAYVLIVPVMESTPLQGTFGKILFGMKVVNRKGRRVSLLHAYFRMLLFSLSTMLFQITIWVNYFINDGRLLHDKLSRSIVVKR